MKNKLILLYLLSSSMFAGIESSQENQQPKTSQKQYEISEKCYNNIQAINKDGGKLFYYCVGAFIATKDNKRFDIKPSNLFGLLVNLASVDNDTNLSYATATWYLKNIISNHLDKFDNDFEKKYEETKDIQKTWTWFEEYFKKALNDIFTTYKQQLIEADQEKQDLAKQGIFPSDDGKTWIIDPSRAK